MRLVFFLFCYLSGFTIFYTKGQKLSGLFKIITWVSKKEQSYYIHNVIVTAEFFILQRENTSRDKKPSTATNNLEGSGVAKEEEGVLRHFKEVTIHPRAPYWTTRRPCCCFYTRSAFQIENLPPPCFTNASDERTLSSILKALTLTTFVH